MHEDRDTNAAPTATARTDGTGHSTVRRILGRRWVVVGLAPLLLVTGCGLTAVLAVRHVLSGYEANLTKIGNPFPATGRPTSVTGAAGAMNLLVICLDRPQSAKARWKVSASRARLAFLVHIPADRKSVTAASLPLGDMVSVPESVRGAAPESSAGTIRTAFDSGGFTLPVQRVENLTGVRLDHVLLIDFDGFKSVIDTLGGVRITVGGTSTGQVQGSVDSGPQVMDGTHARLYLEGTATDPELQARVQDLVRAIDAMWVSSSLLTSPRELNSVLNTLTRNLAVDDAFPSVMYRLAWSLNRVGLSGLRFITPPAAGAGSDSRHGRPTTTQDSQDLDSLWEAVRTDTMNTWIADHGQYVE